MSLLILQLLLLLIATQIAYAFDGQIRPYTVYLGPATLAEMKVSMLSQKDGTQSVNVAVESRGFGAIFGDFKSTLEILRLADGSRVLNGSSSWDDTLSQITVNWMPGVPAPTVDLYRSEPLDYEITIVNPKSIVNTVDPFLPVFEIGLSLDHSKRCEGDYRIYDGIRRYDLSIVDGGDRELLDEAFSGVTHRCIITLKRLGGFSTERGLFKFEESKITRTLYFGKIRDHWIPVRFEIESPLGMAVARLTQGQ